MGGAADKHRGLFKGGYMIPELNSFICGDCMAYMPKFPDKYFDLAIVDPPYGININNNMGRRRGDKQSIYPKAYWDNTPPTVYILMNCSEYQNGVSYGAVIILIYLQQNALSFGESHK